MTVGLNLLARTRSFESPRTLPVLLIARGSYWMASRRRTSTSPSAMPTPHPRSSWHSQGMMIHVPKDSYLLLTSTTKPLSSVSHPVPLSVVKRAAATGGRLHERRKRARTQLLVPILPQRGTHINSCSPRRDRICHPPYESPAVVGHPMRRVDPNADDNWPTSNSRVCPRVTPSPFTQLSKKRLRRYLNTRSRLSASGPIRVSRGRVGSCKRVIVDCQQFFTDWSP